MPELNASAWDNFLANYPNAHILQTTEWGELKSKFGWRAVRIAIGDSGAQILFRRLPLQLSLAYIPKGPLGSNWESLWREIDTVCRKRNAILLKVEPDLWETADRSRDELVPPGFTLSPHPIQPSRTLIVNISGDEDTILLNMKPKTRYNIRLALKKGIVVRPSADIDAVHRLMLVTGGRDDFGVHSPAYYHLAYEQFHSRGKCELLCAEYEGALVAAIMVFAQGKRAWYLYGASANEHRDRMPTYIPGLHRIRSLGCARRGRVRVGSTVYRSV
jgi:peptidoglycan pentaglycine glycine transferase (the first glycine)